MPAPISILVPTLNAEEQLPKLLQSLMPALTAGLIRELVFSDGGSSDGTLEQAEEVGAILVEGAAGRGGQLRRGATVAQGDWLLVLHADTELQGQWVKAMAQHMQEFPNHAGYFRLAFDASGIWPRWVAGWANYRSRKFGLPYGDQGLLISKATYQSVGGFQDIPLMEDVALAQALKGRLRALDGTACTSASRYVGEGWLRRGTRNLWTLLRYRLGAAPEVLARSYQRSRR